MKDYTDSKFNQLNDKMDTMIDKLDRSVHGIVKMIELTNSNIMALGVRIDDHERRITK